MTQSSEHRSNLVSVVTPVFNEQENIPLLYERLKENFAGLDWNWEWVIVDDHSQDETEAVCEAIATATKNVRYIRMARNGGSHLAWMCGFHHAEGDAIVAMAADLQDPPEIIPDLIQKWRDGAQIVSAVRRKREGESRMTLFLSGLYYKVVRNIFGLKWIPETGADFVLMDRRVILSLRNHHQSNVHIFALLAWMGYRQEEVIYDKQARLHGSSGWTFAKKVKLLLDTIIPFSYIPIRFMSVLGACVSFGGFLYALFIIANALSGAVVEGWSSLMVTILILGGLNLLMLGILGEYLWRTYDEARRRPEFEIEKHVHGQSD